MPRVAVTASIEASAGMAAELVAVGLRPVALPCVRIQQADDVDLVRARASAEEADLIVLTSSRALDVLWPEGPIPATPIAVLTPAGAARVEERGGRVAHVGTGNPSDFTAYLIRKAAGLGSLTGEGDPDELPIPTMKAWTHGSPFRLQTRPGNWSPSPCTDGFP